jgi:hypothetical protein
MLEDVRSEQQELQRLLVREPRGRWRRRPRTPAGDRERRVLRDPEARKNIEILAARLADAVDRHLREPLPEATTARLAELVREARELLSLEALLDARRSVEELLLDRADLPLLRQWTAAEYAEEASTLVIWRGLYGADLPELLNDQPDPPSQAVQDTTRARLQRLVAARFWLYRPERARRRLRTSYLRGVAPVVALFGVLLGVAIARQVPNGSGVVLLAAAAGASGASLSGLLRFRDEVRLGGQVREFLPFYLAQVIVGGVFGLAILLVVTAGWLDLGTDAARIGAVSFLAGFSEPFAIGTVARLSERASGVPGRQAPP